jgi:hypothetical protein
MRLTLKRHVHLASMGSEGLRLYFLSLLLAEENSINASRVVLRSALDAISKAVLYDRVYQKFGVKPGAIFNPDLFLEIAQREHEAIESTLEIKDNK